MSARRLRGAECDARARRAGAEGGCARVEARDVHRVRGRRLTLPVAAGPVHQMPQESDLCGGNHHPLPVQGNRHQIQPHPHRARTYRQRQLHGDRGSRHHGLASRACTHNGDTLREPPAAWRAEFSRLASHAAKADQKRRAAQRRQTPRPGARHVPPKPAMPSTGLQCHVGHPWGRCGE